MNSLQIRGGLWKYIYKYPNCNLLFYFRGLWERDSVEFIKKIFHS